ncbi:MAG: endonuclease/exonuclease/phosphatase family protein, partial [Planctomycetota bacterium]|nr:endonuclease/exonuclease/phosphatase family protein [Planctomycetota bacterium]
MLLLAVLLTLPGCNTNPTGKPPAGAFTVLTYNINRDARDAAPVLAMLRAADADVVVLEESTPDWERQLRPALADRYGVILFRHYDRGGGLAFFSRLP